MQLVGVRSTDPDDGLVAVLVEDGGPAMLAIPVTAHEGLVLQAHGSHRSPSWPRLLDDVVEALGGRIGCTELDVDDDARIVARIVVEASAHTDKVTAVPCTPGGGLLHLQSRGVVPKKADSRVGACSPPYCLLDS